MPIHRHLASSETVTLLRGKICWHFYDDAGNKTESVILDANGDVRCINVEKGRWHSLECMESGSVLGKDPEKVVRPYAETHRVNKTREPPPPPAGGVDGVTFLTRNQALNPTSAASD